MPRYIDFTLESSSTDIQVHMEEQSDGTIVITLTADGRPIDIRGLFFDVNDASLIPTLSVSGDFVTGFQALDEGVMDLGRGVNMHGGGREPFDVGVAFGTPGQAHDMVTSTTVVLSSAAAPLTLDMLSLVDFGVRLQGGDAGPKLVETAPAAPDAIDDSLTATEDQSVSYTVLDNDTDADGTADFVILSVTDPEHGTATVSDDGRTIIYTPDENYSGADSFIYAMSDGHGGGDSATASIGVIAVADAPTLSLSAAAGANVNAIEITVSASVTDTDGSESIDRFEFSGLPSGAEIVGESDLVYDPSDTGGTLTQTFTLQLAPDTDFDFDLGVTAVSQESSNGDEARTSDTFNVVVDSTSNAFSLSFVATDQSIWGSGDAFMIEDDRFIGFELDPGESSSGGFIYGSADLYLRAGFQSTLTFDGGSVDASVPYDVTIDTTYNHVTDVLFLESVVDLVSEGVAFATTGPTGSYVLDFLFNYAVEAALGIDFDIESYELFSVDESGDYSMNILNVESSDLGVTFEMPYGLSISLAWPEIDTQSTVSTGTDFTSSGESNNFFELGLDLDQALADIFLRGINPFDVSVDVGVAWGEVQLLDVDLSAGMNFLQEFILSVGDIGASLLFEDGTSQSWDLGDLTIADASSYDADGDGQIELAIAFDQAATFTNDTDLGFNMGYNVALLQANGEWDFGVADGTWSEGPLWEEGEEFPIASVDLYDATFAFTFGQEQVNFTANEALIA